MHLLIGALVQSSVSDAASMVPRAWDIGPTSPMGPSPWPSWNARSHGHLHEGRPLYIHTMCYMSGVYDSKELVKLDVCTHTFSLSLSLSRMEASYDNAMLIPPLFMYDLFHPWMMCMCVWVHVLVVVK